MSFFEKFLGKNKVDKKEDLKAGESIVESPENAFKVGQSDPELIAAALAAKKLQLKYLEGMASLEGRDFEDALRLEAEAEHLAQDMDNVDSDRPDAMKKLRNKAAMIVGILSLTLISAQEARAGGESFTSGDKARLVTNVVDNVFDWLQKREDTKKRKMETERDVRRANIEKDERIGRAAIDEKRDVTREAIRKDKPTNISYGRGGETVTVGIQVESAGELDKALESMNEQIALERKKIEFQKKQKELEELKKMRNELGGQ